jgi:hypothetical protein
VLSSISALKDILLDVASTFDLSESKMLDAESRDSLEMFKWYTGDEFAAAFPQDQIDSWFAGFGTDLRLRIDVIDSAETLHVDAMSGRAKLNQLRQRIAKTQIDHIDVRAMIGKEHLTQVLSVQLGAKLNALYFFAETFTSRLTLSRIQPLFDSGVLPSDGQAVIGVLFARGLTRSRYLTVLGLEDLDTSIFLQLPSPVRYRTKWAHSRLMRDANTIWQGSLSGIDPHYLEVVDVQPGLESISQRLLGLSEVLSILQFCVSVTARSDSTITAQVSRPGGTVLTIAPDASFVASSMAPSAVLGTPALQMFKWAFQGEDYDKIDLVRDLIDREVRGREGDPLPHVVQSATELLTSARAGYKALRSRALERYWKARQEAKDKVDAYVATARSNVDTLRADMLARAIQFFTAIVTFLAIGVFQPGLPRWLKAAGLIFSIVYIVLIGVFQWLPAWLDYYKLCGEAREAVDEYDVLSPSEREQLKARLSSGQRSEFVIWLIVCGGVYAAEFLGFLVLLVVLLARW